MESPARDSYLSSQVLTAPPQKLHLLLVEGALRYVHQAKSSIERGEFTLADQALLRSQRIVTELMAGVAVGGSELGRKLSQVYHFVLRTLIDAILRHDLAQISNAIRVLETERQSWMMICESLGIHPGGADDDRNLGANTIELDRVQSLGEQADKPSKRLSIEA